MFIYVSFQITQSHVYMECILMCLCLNRSKLFLIFLIASAKKKGRTHFACITGCQFYSILYLYAVCTFYVIGWCTDHKPDVYPIPHMISTENGFVSQWPLWDSLVAADLTDTGWPTHVSTLTQFKDL